MMNNEGCCDLGMILFGDKERLEELVGVKESILRCDRFKLCSLVVFPWLLREFVDILPIMV